MHFSVRIVLEVIFVLEVFVRLAAIYVVPRNRKPSSATAWLMLIMLLPTVGLLVFLLIGSPKLSKRRRSKQRVMDHIISKAVDEAAGDPELREFVHFDISDRIDHMVKLTTTLGNLPAFSGNKIAVLSNYDDNFMHIIKDINRADKFIHIEFFIMALDETTEPLFHALEYAVARGVKVRVLFDAFATRRFSNHKNMKKVLTAIGVEWYPMLPFKLPGKYFNRPDLRNH